MYDQRKKERKQKKKKHKPKIESKKKEIKEERNKQDSTVTETGLRNRIRRPWSGASSGPLFGGRHARWDV